MMSIEQHAPELELIDSQRRPRSSLLWARVQETPGTGVQRASQHGRSPTTVVSAGLHDAVGTQGSDRSAAIAELLQHRLRVRAEPGGRVGRCQHGTIEFEPCRRDLHGRPALDRRDCGQQAARGGLAFGQDLREGADLRRRHAGRGQIRPEGDRRVPGQRARHTVSYEL